MPELPAPRPVLWPLRPQASARVSRTAADGQVRVTIEHAPLAGVTPEMLAWWYRHVPGTMMYAGTRQPRYLVWHPLDHISYEIESPGVDGGVSPGARLHITEALGRNLDTLIDIHVGVEEIDDRSATIAKRVLGSSLVRLENEYDAIGGDTRYVTHLVLGDDTVHGHLLLNKVARTKAFPERKLGPWIRHHIEEIGNLENFLPDLVRYHADNEP